MALLAAADGEEGLGERGHLREWGTEHPESGWEGFEASLWLGGG